MTSMVPMVADESALRWLFTQRQAAPLERQVLVVDLVQSGCSGWAYRPAWHATLPQGDFVTSRLVRPEGFSKDSDEDALLLAYPKAHADKMAGVTVSYVRDGLSSRLTFINPQVSDACGCGASVHFGASRTSMPTPLMGQEV